MPAGLQVFNSSGGVEVDFTSIILKEIVISQVVNTNTSQNSVPVTVPAGVTPVVNASYSSANTGSTSGDALPDATYNSGTGNVDYQFRDGGGGRSYQIRMLAL